MKKIFICQPIIGESSEKISSEKSRAENKLKELLNCEILVLDTSCYKFNNALDLIGESIRLIAESDIVFFSGKWRKNKECRWINMLVRDYGCEIMEELWDEEFIKEWKSS
jgi:hypothetical protein